MIFDGNIVTISGLARLVPRPLLFLCGVNVFMFIMDILMRFDFDEFHGHFHMLIPTAVLLLPSQLLVYL